MKITSITLDAFFKEMQVYVNECPNDPTVIKCIQIAKKEQKNGNAIDKGKHNKNQ